MAHGYPNPDEKPGWADTPGFQRLFLGGLIGACLTAAALGFFFGKKEPHFAVEGVPVFFAVYGFVMFSFIVLAGQHLRKLVSRPENYYDERE